MLAQIAASLLSIVDKCVPGRKEALNNELDKQEKLLAMYLAGFNNTAADIVRANINKLRRRIELVK